MIGDFDNPKIYGAGLLSSIGESYSSLQPNVKKLPLTKKRIDITLRLDTIKKLKKLKKKTGKPISRIIEEKIINC